MKRTLILLAVLAFVNAAGAGDLQRQILTVVTGTNATDKVVATNTTIRGYIHSIDVDVVDSGATGTLDVVVVPEVSTMTNQTLYTGSAITADAYIRPRFDSTDSTGSALTGDPPERYLVFGDSIQFSVTNASATNLTFKAVIKYEDK